MESYNSPANEALLGQIGQNGVNSNGEMTSSSSSSSYYDLVPLSNQSLSDQTSAQSQNYRYAIDKSTGNLLIIQDGETNLSSLSGDALALLQVLDDCVLETPSAEHLTFHAVDHEGEILPDVPEDDKTDDEDESSPPTPPPPPLRRAVWSRRKITDFIQCIHNHEQRLRKSSKIRGVIWNDISKDMFELGHRDCNKDECSKKWSNLYRTWKKVKLRRKEDRQKWQYFNLVSNLVKSISHRDTATDKRFSKQSVKSSTQELIIKLMEQNRRHQERVQNAEKIFQDQVSVMDRERDELIDAIMEIL